MDHDQKIRYSGNISIAEIGTEGQEILTNSKLLVVGAGGLGSPVILYSAAAGIGTIGVIDYDYVELSNLQRQIIYETSDIKRNKTESVAEAVFDLNPNIKINCYKEKLSENNIEELFSDYEIIADCSDNFETRFLINNYCHKMKKILVAAAVEKFQGYVSTFKSYLGGENPCYLCFNPNINIQNNHTSCSQYGILGSVAGITGSLQATEIIKELTSAGDSLSGFLLRFNALNHSFKKVKIKLNPDCLCCSKKKI